MFSDDDERHPDWEMSQATQRKFSIGVAIVIAAVVMLNFVGHHPNFWAKEDAETVLASRIDQTTLR